MTIEKRLMEMERRIQANRDMDDEIAALLREFTPEEQAELLAQFIREHEFYDPSRLTEAERATNRHLRVSLGDEWPFTDT